MALHSAVSGSTNVTLKISQQGIPTISATLVVLEVWAFVVQRYCSNT